MSRSDSRYLLVLIVLAAFSLGIVTPAVAGWTKVYRVTNTTGISQSGLTARLNAIESITAQRADSSYPALSQAAVGSETAGAGVTYTVLTYPKSPSNGTLANNAAMTIGWTTLDNKCQLTEMRWASGNPPGSTLPVASPNQTGGVAGGGIAFYNPSWATDKLIFVITNDNKTAGSEVASDLWLHYDGTDYGGVQFNVVQYALSPQPLGLPYLYRLLRDGFSAAAGDGQVIPSDAGCFSTALPYHTLVGVSANEASDGIIALRNKIPIPMHSDLVWYLTQALSHTGNGLTAYQAGHRTTAPPSEPTALAEWQSAADMMQSFINAAKVLKGTSVSEIEYNQWVVDGIGPAGTVSATACHIRDVLLELVKEPLMLEGNDLQGLSAPDNLVSLFSTTYDCGLSPVNYRGWPNLDLGDGNSKLYPGQWTAMKVDPPAGWPPATSGWALIVRGEATTLAGDQYAWLEQIVAEPAPTLKVRNAVATPASHPPDPNDHSLLIPTPSAMVLVTLTVTHSGTAGWEIADVACVQPDGNRDADGQWDDGDGQSPVGGQTLRLWAAPAIRGSSYQVKLRALGSNSSESQPVTLLIPVV